MLALGTIVSTWLGQNVKFIVYFLIASMVAGAAWKLYSVIEENGRYEAQIMILEHNNKVKNDQIDALRESFRLANELVVERDKELEKLAEDMKGMTDNLGVGADDQAADSLKEYFKRLNK